MGSAVYSGKWQCNMAQAFVPVQRAVMVPLYVN